MKKLFLLYLLSVFAFASCINGLSGRIVAVSDGDTFTLLDAANKQYKVRLHGVDCPEKNQPYGQKAKEFTSALIFEKNVTVEITDTDKYSRIVGIVYVDEVVLNEELLSSGYAWHYKQYDDSEWYALLELEARAQKRGLWADARPVPPWSFRKNKTGKTAKSTNKTTASYVLVCSSGKSYHTPDCSVVARCSNVLRYSEKDAKANGLKPCKQCH